MSIDKVAWQKRLKRCEAAWPKETRFDLHAWAEHCRTWEAIGPKRLEGPYLNATSLREAMRVAKAEWFDRCWSYDCESVNQSLSGMPRLVVENRVGTKRQRGMFCEKFGWALRLIQTALNVGKCDLWERAWHESDRYLKARIEANEGTRDALADLAEWCRLKSELLKDRIGGFADTWLPIREVIEPPWRYGEPMPREQYLAWMPLEYEDTSSMRPLRVNAARGKPLSSIVMQIVAPLFHATDKDALADAVATLPLLPEDSKLGWSYGVRLPDSAGEDGSAGEDKSYVVDAGQVVAVDAMIRLAWEFARLCRPSGVAPPPEPTNKVVAIIAAQNCLDTIIAWCEANAGTEREKSAGFERQESAGAG